MLYFLCHRDQKTVNPHPPLGIAEDWNTPGKYQNGAAFHLSRFGAQVSCDGNQGRAETLSIIRILTINELIGRWKKWSSYVNESELIALFSDRFKFSNEL